MANTDSQVNAGGIGNLPIDPNAEPKTGTQPPAVSGQDEIKFFDNAGRQYQLQHHQQNLGFLGKFFGSNSEAPNNIAGLVAIGSLLLYGATMLLPDSVGVSDLRKTLGTIVVSAVSFVFGAASKK